MDETYNAYTYEVLGGAAPGDENVPHENAGRKNDTGKPRMDLIPPEVPFALATVLGFGAAKYDDRNWEKGMDWGRVFAAMMRHGWSWWGGQGPTSTNFAFGVLDDETEFSHLWHLLACASFLVTYEERGIGIDTRAGAGVLAEPELEPEPEPDYVTGDLSVVGVGLLPGDEVLLQCVKEGADGSVFHDGSIYTVHVGPVNSGKDRYSCIIKDSAGSYRYATDAVFRILKPVEAS